MATIKVAKIQAPVFALETVLTETAKQLGNYAHAQGKYETAVKDRENAKAVLDRLIPQLHKHGVKLGELPRTGADTGYKGVKVTPAQALSVGVYNAMPADLTHAVKKNYLSALRQCVDSNHKFSLNLSRDRTKGAKDSAKEIVKDVAQKAPKTPDQKHGEVKQSLADVIKANFKTLLKNNPQVAADLLDQLAEMLDA